MVKPNEAIRRSKDYIEIKEAFKNDPEGTLLCLKERLTGHAMLIDIYQKELKKLLTKKSQKEECLLGVEETLKSGKMIAKWIKRLEKDYAEYDFSSYSELIEIAENIKSM